MSPRRTALVQCHVTTYLWSGASAPHVGVTFDVCDGAENRDRSTALRPYMRESMQLAIVELPYWMDGCRVERVQPIEPDPESLRSAPYQPRSGNDAVTLACLF